MNGDNILSFGQPDALTKFANSSAVQGRYGGADVERLSAFEERYNIRFSDAYRSILMRENGLDYYFSSDGDSRPAEERRDAFILSDINTLFGIGNGHEHYDLEALAPDMGFHDYNFTPFAHVIGLGGDFCTLVEIVEGTHAGRIMYTDGELFWGVRKDGIAGKSTDDAINYLIEIGYYMPIANDLSELLEKYARLT